VSRFLKRRATHRDLAREHHGRRSVPRDVRANSLPRNEKVRASQEACPDNRPPRECAAVVVFAVVLARGDTNNIGSQSPLTLAIFADCSERSFRVCNLLGGAVPAAFLTGCFVARRAQAARLLLGELRSSSIALVLRAAVRALLAFAAAK